MDPSDAILLVVLIILLLLSAFFSSAETALTTVNKIRIRTLAEEGDKRAVILLDITEDSGKMLSAILIGNNIVNISASAIATTVAYNIKGLSVGVMTGLLTLLVLLFGEITPKTMATIHAEKMGLSYARVVYVFMKIMTPVIFVINKLALGVLMLLRVDPGAGKQAMTESELRTIVDVGHEDGVIETEEKEMINNVFDLGDAIAKDVMVPRIHVTFADINSTYEELIDIFKEDKFTRLPIYEDTTDHVVGIINMKDLLLSDNTKDFRIQDIMREAHFTYEFKNISELLIEMKDASFNIAIVLDEYGETSGLITLEDLLEEIVGEIHDEYDENEEEAIKQTAPNTYLIEGATNLEELNNELDLELESEDYDSIGGFIIEHLDRMPVVGDHITTEDGIKLKVLTLDKNRIEQVELILPEDNTKEEGCD